MAKDHSSVPGAVPPSALSRCLPPAFSEYGGEHCAELLAQVDALWINEANRPQELPSAASGWLAARGFEELIAVSGGYEQIAQPELLPAAVAEEPTSPGSLAIWLACLFGLSVRSAKIVRHNPSALQRGLRQLRLELTGSLPPARLGQLRAAVRWLLPATVILTDESIVVGQLTDHSEISGAVV